MPGINHTEKVIPQIPPSLTNVIYDVDSTTTITVYSAVRRASNLTYDKRDGDDLYIEIELSAAFCCAVCEKAGPSD
ncbi:hypothetical protein OS11_22810 [Dickeya oryzae]